MTTLDFILNIVKFAAGWVIGSFIGIAIMDLVKWKWYKQRKLAGDLLTDAYAKNDFYVTKGFVTFNNNSELFYISTTWLSILFKYEINCLNRTPRRIGVFRNSELAKRIDLIFETAPTIEQYFETIKQRHIRDLENHMKKFRGENPDE